LAGKDTRINGVLNSFNAASQFPFMFTTALD
jgi:hypothetical protein